MDAAWGRALATGATPVIADPDGHLWELVFDPDLLPGDEPSADAAPR